MQEVVFIVEEAQEGGFTAKCTTESIFTQAETLEGLKEAIIDYFEQNGYFNIEAASA